MALFKPQALPVVTDDIATSIHRASHNSSTAISLLHTVVRIDPPDIDVDSVISHLSDDVFRLREECYPAQELARLTETLRQINLNEAGYWPVYAYLFALLPVLVERPRVGNTHWTPEEYRQLEITCFSRWANAHGDVSDTSFTDGYNRMCSATKSWFKRKTKLTPAKDWCLAKTVDQIERSFARQEGAVRVKGFRYAVEEFVGTLCFAFRADLAQYWLGAGSLGFLASDPSPLPPYIDKASGWP